MLLVQIKCGVKWITTYAIKQNIINIKTSDLYRILET